jgi:hypothetical protein
MGFWTNKVHRTGFDDAEGLAYAPSGGRVKMWFCGVGVALIPLGYGVHCLRTGEARFMDNQGEAVDLQGSAASALAIAYLAIGVFIHAHWFWGLQPRFAAWSYLFKLAAVLVFLGSLGYTMYRIMS